MIGNIDTKKTNSIRHHFCAIPPAYNNIDGIKQTGTQSSFSEDKIM